MRQPPVGKVMEMEILASLLDIAVTDVIPKSVASIRDGFLKHLAIPEDSLAKISIEGHIWHTIARLSIQKENELEEITLNKAEEKIRKSPASIDPYLRDLTEALAERVKKRDRAKGIKINGEGGEA